MMLFAQLSAELSPRITSWLTPVWILGLGVMAGLMALALLWGLLFLLSLGIGGGFRKFVREIPSILTEGVLWPTTVIATVMASLGVLGYFTSIDQEEILRSITQIPAISSSTTDYKVPKESGGDPFAQEELPVKFDSSRMSTLRIETNEEVLVSTIEISELSIRSAISVSPDKPYEVKRTRGSRPFGGAVIEKFYVVNKGAGEATLRISLGTAPEAPQVWSIVTIGLGVVAFYLLYVAQRVFMPKLSAIALATFKSNVNQPLFVIISILGVVMLIAFIWIPYNTFGDDIKMVKVTSLSSIRVLAMILAIWCASTSVSEEIEGRTALTVLSKPIDRRSFVLGKFAGIAWVLALLFIIFAFVFLITVAYKPIYDARENSLPVPSWQQCHAEMLSIIPGMLLTFMESMVLVALSVMISTRLPMMVNFVLCFSLYALGHLTPLIVQSSTSGFDIVRFFASLVAVVVPNLDHFDVEAAVHAGVGIPAEYLGYSLLYCAIYSAAAMILALLMFEDRDLT